MRWPMGQVHEHFVEYLAKAAANQFTEALNHG